MTEEDSFEDPKKIFVRFKLFKDKETLETMAKFHELMIPGHNGRNLVSPPKEMVSLGLRDVLENNRSYIVFGNSVYVRKDGINTSRNLKDKKGNKYLEKTYALDIFQTSCHRNKQED